MLTAVQEFYELLETWQELEPTVQEQIDTPFQSPVRVYQVCRDIVSLCLTNCHTFPFLLTLQASRYLLLHKRDLIRSQLEIMRAAVTGSDSDLEATVRNETRVTMAASSRSAGSSHVYIWCWGVPLRFGVVQQRVTNEAWTIFRDVVRAVQNAVRRHRQRAATRMKQLLRKQIQRRREARAQAAASTPPISGQVPPPSGLPHQGTEPQPRQRRRRRSSVAEIKEDLSRLAKTRGAADLPSAADSENQDRVAQRRVRRASFVVETVVGSANAKDAQERIQSAVKRRRSLMSGDEDNMKAAAAAVAAAAAASAAVAATAADVPHGTSAAPSQKSGQDPRGAAQQKSHRSETEGENGSAPARTLGPKRVSRYEAKRKAAAALRELKQARRTSVAMDAGAFAAMLGVKATSRHEPSLERVDDE